MKSSRNKTIDFSVKEDARFLERCVKPDEISDLSGVMCRTILGDSFECMEKLPRAFADLAIIDPPYNIRKNFGGSIFPKLDDGQYALYTEKWLDAIAPLLKHTASIYVCCDFRCSGIIGTELSKRFIVRNRITWQREKGRGAAKNWKNNIEDIWFATVSGDYTFNLDAVKAKRRVIAPYRQNGKPKDWEDTPEGKFRLTCPSNFWDDITVPYWSMSENTAHPTQKPEKLLAKLILASSNAGDTVFDPFLGSGSTSVTAKKLGRKYIGIEKCEQYCSWAEHRLDMAEESPEIQGFEDGIFLPRNNR